MLRFRDLGQFLLLLPLLVIALLHTDLGSFIIKKQIENELSSRAERDIRIGRFDFNWPKRLLFYDLTIENHTGSPILIKEIQVDTSLTSLLTGNITEATLNLINLQAKQIEISNLTAQINFNDLTRYWNYSLRAKDAESRYLKAQGAFSATDEGYGLEVVDCKIGDEKHFVTLQNPFHILFDGSSINSTPALFNYENTSFEMQLIGNSQTFKAYLSGHISSLETLPLSLPDLGLGGKCDVDVHVSGDWSNPQIQGSIKIRQGRFENIKSGALFQSINADCAIDNDGIHLTNFAAEDITGGRLRAAGDMKFDRELLFPYQIRMHLANAAVVNLEDAHCYVTGDAIFEGNKRGGVISGDLKADKVDLFLKEGKSSAIHDFDVTYINQPIQEKPLNTSKKSTENWPIELNLHVKGSAISISDENLTSQWKGDLSISGSDENPLLQGDCRLQSGSYLFNGKKFDLTQGTIAFNGDLKKKTQLYVVGSQEITFIQVEVILKGPLQDLSLAFRSNPQISEREILCLLLFGRGTGEITSFQGAELTESINKLKSQAGGGSNFIEDFKKRIGLDRIDITHGSGVENEDISLQVGKYVTPGVFVGVKKGITTDANRIGIEADLRKNVKIQAEYGDDSVGHLHLKWKHDY